MCVPAGRRDVRKRALGVRQPSLGARRAVGVDERQPPPAVVVEPRLRVRRAVARVRRVARQRAQSAIEVALGALRKARHRRAVGGGRLCDRDRVQRLKQRHDVPDRRQRVAIAVVQARSYSRACCRPSAVSPAPRPPARASGSAVARPIAAPTAARSRSGSAPCGPSVPWHVRVRPGRAGLCSSIFVLRARWYIRRIYHGYRALFAQYKYLSSPGCRPVRWRVAARLGARVPVRACGRRRVRADDGGGDGERKRREGECEPAHR